MLFRSPNGDILFCSGWRDSLGNIREVLAKLNPNGDSIWIRRYAPINGFLLNYIFDFAKIELDGGFFLTGFGHQDSNAYQDAFIMRVDSNGLMNDCFPVGLAPEIEQTLFLVYPNPANHILNVSMQLPGKNEIVELEIFDMTGKVLRRNWFSEKLHQTDISDLTTGIYLYKITSSSGVQASGKFLKN